MYKRPLYFLRRVWWCLSHYHWTLHFRCSVEAMISLNLAISTAVMAMKLQLVTDAEIFCKKKVDISFCHDKTMSYVYSRTCHWKQNWKNAHNFVHMDTSIVPLAYSHYLFVFFHYILLIFFNYVGFFLWLFLLLMFSRILLILLWCRVVILCDHMVWDQRRVMLSSRCTCCT